MAFASDRYGNFDVFVMPSDGGEAKRLTYHSAREIPNSFAADDRSVLFSATRQVLPRTCSFQPAACRSAARSGGGRAGVDRLDDAGAGCHSEFVRRQDSLPRLQGLRKRLAKASHVCRDARRLGLRHQTENARLSSFNGEDRNPVFDANDTDFYYLSEQSGSFNVYKSSVRNPAQSVAVTRFTSNPVRFLTRAKNGTLAFSYDGELYTMAPGVAEVAVRIGADGRNAIEDPAGQRRHDRSKACPEWEGVRIRVPGEIFVSSIDGKFVKRITNTPWQERGVSFSSDGRSLVCAAERTTTGTSIPSL